MRTALLLPLACVFLGGCWLNDETEAAAQNVPETTAYDVLAGLREKGWKIKNESVKHQSGRDMLYFQAGDVLFCAITKSKYPENSEVDSIHKNGFLVLSLPMYDSSEAWDKFCADPEFANSDFCSLSFEEKMKRQAKWASDLLKDAESVIP